MKVWAIELFPGASVCYTQRLENVTALLEDSEVGDEIKITVREMPEKEYANLPEWDGP